MTFRDYIPELTADELRLLPLLATPLSFLEISQILDVPRAEVQAAAVSIYAKLGIELQRRSRAEDDPRPG
jgi:ATP/maltotriose-dependent transcriptional regulator MalT